jgi:hypothetical protein
MFERPPAPIMHESKEAACIDARPMQLRWQDAREGYQLP